MVVRPVEPGAGDDGRKQPEERFMPRVHPDGDLGLSAVAAEAPLPHEDTDQKAEREAVFGDGQGHPPVTCGCCYTVW